MSSWKGPVGTIKSNSLLLAGLHKTQLLAQLQHFQTPIYRCAWFRLPCWKCDTKNDNPRMRSTGFRVLAFLEGSVAIIEPSFSTPSESQADREVFYLFLGAQLVPVQGRTCPGCAGSSCLCALTLPMSKQKMSLCFFPLFTIPAALGKPLGEG